MLYYNRKTLTIDSNIATIFTLRDITISEIQKKRIKNDKFFILKDFDNLYTINEYLDDKSYYLLNEFLKFNVPKPLCNMCNVNTCMRCQKIIDRPFCLRKGKKVLKECYVSSKRIEKYRFIYSGFETNDRFCVGMCKYFNNPNEENE